MPADVRKELEARDGVRTVLFRKVNAKSVNSKRKVDDESVNLSRKMDRSSKKTSIRGKKVRNSKQKSVQGSLDISWGDLAMEEDAEAEVPPSTPKDKFFQDMRSYDKSSGVHHLTYSPGDMNKQVDLSNYERVNVKSDGHCLYHAILGASEAIGQPPGKAVDGKAYC